MKDKEAMQTGMEETQVSIPEWTLEDFTGTEPYRWLYDHRENKLLYRQLVITAKNLAKRCHFNITDFNDMLSGYIASRMPKNADNYVTAFPGQKHEFVSGKYICDNDGVRYTWKLGEEIAVCSHPILPIARIINQDTGEQHVRIAFRRGGVWKTLDVEKKVAYTAKKAADCLSGKGIAVTSENAKYLVAYLCDMESMNYDTLPEIRMTSKLGWHDDRFVPYDGTLKYLDNGNSQLVGAIRQHGDFDAWLNTAKETRTGETRYLPVRMAMAASFASPLLSKIGYLPCLCNIWSSISSIGKTVLIMLAASVWGNPEIGRGLPMTANGTVNSLEVIAATLNNIPLFLDELQTVQQERGFANTVYNLCEGSGKNRLDSSVELRNFLHWNLITITSGEQAVATDRDKEGALARVVDVTVAEAIFPDPHEVVNIIKSNYGHAGKQFVEMLSKENFDELKQEANRISKSLQDDGVQAKQADSGAVLIIADRLAAKYVFHDENALTVSDVKKYLKLRVDTDLNRRVYEYVCGWCFQYRNNFEDADNRFPTQYYGKKVDENHYRILKKPLQDELARNGYDFRSFVEWCVNHKVIEDERGRQGRHAGGNPQWLLDFHTDVLDQEEPPADEKTAYTQIMAEDIPDLPF